MIFQIDEVALKKIIDIIKEDSSGNSKYYLIILGWILGLLSTLIVDGIKKIYKKRRIKKGITQELNYLRIQLIMIFLSYYVKFYSIGGSKSISVQETDLFPYIRMYILQPFNLMQYEKKIIKNITDEECLKFLNSLDTFGSFIFPKFDIPFIEINLEFLTFYSSEYQSTIMQLRRRIQNINHLIDNNLYLYLKTLDVGPKKIKEINIAYGFYSEQIGATAWKLIKYLETLIPK